ncbi:MAG: hypothetical protein MRY63_08825 [Neomegalonema sp.]|nr:hypothetical protein [Neomegalonema sp.]
MLHLLLPNLSARSSHRQRRSAFLPLLLVGTALGMGSPTPASAQETPAPAPSAAPAPLPQGPATAWRFLSGSGVDGILSPATQESEQIGIHIGAFVLNIAGRGTFQGIYNLRGDARSLVGVFWLGEDEERGVIEGIIDIGAAPDGALGEREGRITFMSGREHIHFDAY